MFSNATADPNAGAKIQAIFLELWGNPFLYGQVIVYSSFLIGAMVVLAVINFSKEV